MITESASPLADFRTSLKIPFVGVAGSAIGIFGAASEHPWIFVAGSALLAIGVAEFFWLWHSPSLMIYPSVLVYRPSLLVPARRIPCASIAGWAYSQRWIGVQSLDSKRTYIALTVYQEKDRERLISHLEALDLGRPELSVISAQELQVRERRLLGAAGLAAACIVVAVFLVVFRIIA